MPPQNSTNSSMSQKNKCKSQRVCKCPIAHKVPQDGAAFLKNQRSDRKLTLGSYDRATTLARDAREIRRSVRQDPERRDLTASELFVSLLESPSPPAADAEREPAPGPSGLSSGGSAESTVLIWVCASRMMTIATSCLLSMVPLLLRIVT